MKLYVEYNVARIQATELAHGYLYVCKHLRFVWRGIAWCVHGWSLYTFTIVNEACTTPNVLYNCKR